MSLILTECPILMDSKFSRYQLLIVVDVMLSLLLSKDDISKIAGEVFSTNNVYFSALLLLEADRNSGKMTYDLNH